MLKETIRCQVWNRKVGSGKNQKLITIPSGSKIDVGDFVLIQKEDN